jgi:hypothetical protein
VAVYYQSSTFGGKTEAKGGCGNYGGGPVCAGDGTVYILDKSLPLPSPLKTISSFNFSNLNPSVTGVVDENNHAISLTVPYGTDVTALVPTITISDKASISPNNNVAQDFTNPVTYTVIAEDKSTQNYMVTVIIAPNPNPNPPPSPPVTQNQLKIITTSQTISANTPSGIITVESQDSKGASTKVTSTTYVNLSSSSTTGIFASGSASLNSCETDWTKTSITISKGDANKSFCYKDSTAGTPTITVSADGFSSDSQVFTVN